MSQKVLVVCAHPDDEALGIGGTLARHADEGDDVDLLFLTDGVTARDASFNPLKRADDIASRKFMAINAAKAMGLREPRFLDLQNNRLDGVELLDIVKKIEATIALLRPAIIYTNHINDINIDHRIAHLSVLTACRPLPDNIIRSIYAFETLSNTEWEPAGYGRQFQPTRYVDISSYTSAKMNAIQAYDQEMRQFPHPRSREALEAQWTLRGAQVGVKAAEALVVVREIV